MKTNLIAMLVMAAACIPSVAKAQSSDQVILNVKLYPIQTIVINGTTSAPDKILDLVYDTEEKYKNGVSVTANDQLTIYSTGGFNVKVKADGDLQNNANSIEANSIQISATDGTHLLSNSQYQTQRLSKSDQVIISNDAGGIDRSFHIHYAGKGGNAYLNLYKKANSSVDGNNVFTTKLTYTIEAK